MLSIYAHKKKIFTHTKIFKEGDKHLNMPSFKYSFKSSLLGKEGPL